MDTVSPFLFRQKALSSLDSTSGGALVRPAAQWSAKSPFRNRIKSLPAQPQQSEDDVKSQLIAEILAGVFDSTDGKSLTWDDKAAKGPKRAEGETWEGAKNRWFTVRDGKTVPTKRPVGNEGSAPSTSPESGGTTSTAEPADSKPTAGKKPDATKPVKLTLDQAKQTVAELKQQGPTEDTLNMLVGSLATLTVADLKKLHAEMGVKGGGLKADLIAKIKDTLTAVKDADVPEAEAAPEAAPTPAAPPKKSPAPKAMPRVIDPAKIPKSTAKLSMDNPTAVKSLISRLFKGVKGFKPGMVTPEHVASMVGAPDDAEVTLRIAGSNLYVEMSHPTVKKYTCVLFMHNDKPAILNQSIYIADGMTGKGVGTSMFARQAAAASVAGVSKITCTASGAKGSGENGYYTWAALGFDAPISKLNRDVIKKAKKAYPEAKRVSDIMKTPDGRAWWKENGDTFTADFDLKPTSLSMGLLDNYVKNRAGRERTSSGPQGKSLQSEDDVKAQLIAEILAGVFGDEGKKSLQWSGKAAQNRSEGETWQGQSGRWFTISDGRSVPTKAPGGDGGSAPASSPASDESNSAGAKPADDKKPVTSAPVKLTFDQAKQVVTELKKVGPTEETLSELVGSLATLTVADLKKLHAELGIKGGGAKADLIAKIKETLSGVENAKPPEPEAAPVPTDAISRATRLAQRIDAMGKGATPELPASLKSSGQWPISTSGRKAMLNRANAMATAWDEALPAAKDSAAVVIAEIDAALESLAAERDKPVSERTAEGEARMWAAARSLITRKNKLNVESVDAKRRFFLAAFGVKNPKPIPLAISDEDSAAFEAAGGFPEGAWTEGTTFLSSILSRDRKLNVDVKYDADPRAYHVAAGGDRKKAFVAVGVRVNPATVVHELAHEIEMSYDIGRGLTKMFRDSRFNPSEDVPMRKYDPTYGEGEVGNPDDMEKLTGKEQTAAYVGKAYKNGQTEIISMGIEYLYRDPIHFAKADPEYFALMIDVLQGKY